jgi:hypothetical protein
LRKASVIIDAMELEAAFVLEERRVRGVRSAGRLGYQR